MSVSGGRRAAFAALCVIALACDEPALDRTPEPPRAQPPRGSACELDDPSAFSGAPVALAANALIVQGSAGLHLLRLDEPERPIALDVESVPRRGLVARASSLLALAGTTAGPVLLVIEGDSVQRIALGEGALRDGALATRGDHASAAWVDGEGALRTTRIDLLRARASEPQIVATIEHGAPLVTATRTGAIVSWTARGASLVTVDEGPITGADAPGTPLDLLGGAEHAIVLHESGDRTGAWLSSAGAPSVRVTSPEARPAAASIEPLPDGSALVYREDADVFLQRLGEDAIPRGGPVVAGSSGPAAPHAPPLLATEGARVWIAWQSRDETGPQARVRSAHCR